MREERGDPVLEEYSRLAQRYERRWFRYVESTTRATLAGFAPAPAARILDVGCGTGFLLAQLARDLPRARLVGLDPVPEMLAVAESRLPPSVRLCRGRAEELPFEDDAFDAVISVSVLHFIGRPDRALSEMRRVLRPGGELVLTDWCADYLACRVMDRVLRLLGGAHVEAYGTRDLRRMLATAGLPDARIDSYRIDWLWGLMTARATNPSGPCRTAPAGG